MVNKITLYVIVILAFTSCKVICPCKSKPASIPIVEKPYAVWRSQYVLHKLDASEYIDLLEGEIDKLNTPKK